MIDCLKTIYHNDRDVSCWLLSAKFFGFLLCLGGSRSIHLSYKPNITSKYENTFQLYQYWRS
jgi:hypothetical protein